MRYQDMSPTGQMYFQMARGRAIARGNAMKEARRTKRMIALIQAGSRPTEVFRGEMAYTLSREGLLEVLAHRVKINVQRARDCHRYHRIYRRKMAEYSN